MIGGERSFAMVVVTARDAKRLWLPEVSGKARTARSHIEDRKKEAITHAMDGEEEGLRLSQNSALVMTALVSNMAKCVELLQSWKDEKVIVAMTHCIPFTRADKADVQGGALWAHFKLPPGETKVKIAFNQEAVLGGSFDCIAQIRDGSMSRNDRDLLYDPVKKPIYLAAMTIAIRIHLTSGGE
jgi:hypothetical protein